MSTLNQRWVFTRFSISCFLFKTLNQNELHKGLKKYSKGDFFTIKSLQINENISIIRQDMNLNLLTLREINYKDHTKFFRLILLLSDDINLNPGPTQILETWSVFKKRWLHFVDLNINSLPSKTEELRQIAKDTSPAVIGLSETKLDKTISDCEISIPNYSLIRKAGTERAEGLHVISQAIFALIAKINYQTKLKIFLLTCYSRKQNLFLLPLYTNLQLIIASWNTPENKTYFYCDYIKTSNW